MIKARINTSPPVEGLPNGYFGPKLLRHNDLQGTLPPFDPSPGHQQEKKSNVTKMYSLLYKCITIKSHSEFGKDSTSLCPRFSEFPQFWTGRRVEGFEKAHLSHCFYYTYTLLQTLLPQVEEFPNFNKNNQLLRRMITQ
jgi:hypothetical protein